MEFNQSLLSKFVKVNRLGVTGDVPAVCLVDDSTHPDVPSAMKRAHECLRAIGKTTSVRIEDARNLYRSLQ